MDDVYAEWYEQMRAGRVEESTERDRGEPVDTELEKLRIEKPEP